MYLNWTDSSSFQPGKQNSKSQSVPICWPQTRWKNLTRPLRVRFRFFQRVSGPASCRIDPFHFAFWVQFAFIHRLAANPRIFPYKAFNLLNLWKKTPRAYRIFRWVFFLCIKLFPAILDPHDKPANSLGGGAGGTPGWFCRAGLKNYFVVNGLSAHPKF